MTIIVDRMLVNKSNKGALDRSIPYHVSCANNNPWGVMAMSFSPRRHLSIVN